MDLRWIDFNVDLLGIDRIGLQIPRDAIIESHAECKQKIRLLDGGVDPSLTMHPHHAQIEWVAGGKTANPEQCHRDWDLSLLNEFA